MPENEKKNGVLSMLKGVFMGKREECGDIITQAEKVISDYIYKRRNEIINKYCKKKNHCIAFAVLGVSGALLYIAYTLLA